MSQTPQPQPAPAPPPPLPQPPSAPPVNRCADVGFVLGLVSVVTFCFCFIAVPTAIAGLVLSIMGIARARTLGTGIFAGVAGIILSAFSLLVSTPLLMMMGGFGAIGGFAGQ